MSHESPERCLARADLCRFLAACHYEPGPEFAEERLFDFMLAAARATDVGIAASVERLGALFFADPLDTLLVDYARLFLGLRNQDERALSGYAVIRRRLLEEHLGLWVPQFAVSVTDNAATGFYRELSAVTSRVVAHESQAVF